nr:discoidin domain-containing protein [Tessaracoccus coleopterorum]
MSVVAVNSVEPEAELGRGGGPAEYVLDGNRDTYWHTKWQGGVDPLPHHLTVKLADEAVQVGRVTLTPRQSSNGSGRVNEYELLAATGPDCTAATYTKVAEGSFPGDVASALTDRVITLDQPVDANCLQVRYLSTWGGVRGADPISPAETVGSLAEFNVETVSGEVTPPTRPEIVIPEGTVEIADGDLTVRMHPGFPQVVDYRLGDKQLAGRLGDALTSILVNEEEQPVTVGAPVKSDDGRSATYALTFPNLEGVSFDAVASVKEGVFTLTLTGLVDPDNDVRRVRIPNHDLVTVTSDDAASQLTAGRISPDRNNVADSFDNVAASAPVPCGAPT